MRVYHLQYQKLKSTDGKLAPETFPLLLNSGCQSSLCAFQGDTAEFLSCAADQFVWLTGV